MIGAQTEPVANRLITFKTCFDDVLKYLKDDLTGI